MENLSYTIPVAGSTDTTGQGRSLSGPPCPAASRTALLKIGTLGSELRPGLAKKRRRWKRDRGPCGSRPGTAGAPGARLHCAPVYLTGGNGRLSKLAPRESPETGPRTGGLGCGENVPSPAPRSGAAPGGSRDAGRPRPPPAHTPSLGASGARAAAQAGGWGSGAPGSEPPPNLPAAASGSGPAGPG